MNYIPLFPLNLVIYPGAKYPLHIFEDRYKIMINKSINDNEPFGIVSKIDLEISKVGCLVNVDSVLKIYENGSMDIIVNGLERFKILSTSFHKDGYMLAEKEKYFDLDNLGYNISVYEKTLDIFTNILDRTAIELGQSFWTSLESAKIKSFKLAEKSGLNLEQQQTLLSLQSENKRLDFLLEHFEKIDNYLDSNQTVKDIIAGDGYLN